MMRYRHIKKVPATPQQFSVRDQKNPEAPIANSDVVVEPDDIVATVEANSADTIQSVAVEEVASLVQAEIPCDTVQVKAKTSSEIVASFPVRKDRSLFIAVLMILAGIVLIFLGIFLISLFQANLVVQVLIALLCLLAVWKLLSFGTKIFIARFRTDKTYKEN